MGGTEEQVYDGDGDGNPERNRGGKIDELNPTTVFLLNSLDNHRLLHSLFAQARCEIAQSVANPLRRHR